MTIRILCVGKLKEPYFEAAEAEFQKRLRRFCTVEIAEVPDERAPETLSAAQRRQVMDREGERHHVLVRADARKQPLSDMTLPHRIARLVLLELVYRAHKIVFGEPYHK